MAQDTPSPSDAVLDVTTGATLAGVRVVTALVRPPAGRLLPLARRAAAVGVAVTPRVVADAVDALRQDGRGARYRARRRAAQAWRAAVPAVLELVLDQIDLTALVLRRVDLDAVAARLDVDAVAARLDLDAVAAGLDVEKILDRLDLNALVEQRVDLDRLAGGLDIDAILGRVDLIGLAEYIVDGIDLPKVIRDSTGSVASEGLRGVRTRSMEADQALAGLVDRMLLRRRSARARENGSASAPATGPGAGHAD